VSVCRIAKHVACLVLTVALHSRAVLWCRIGAAAGTAAEAEAEAAGWTTEVSTHAKAIAHTVTTTTTRFINSHPQPGLAAPWAACSSIVTATTLTSITF
jgi:hypothetical protein